MVSEFAAAKINLSLHVTGKREDNYHTLEMLVAFANIGDTIHLAKSDALSLTITGPFATGLNTEDNLVIQAAKLFKQTFNKSVNFDIILEKHLPIASGIGGGSADAAATLRALAKYHKITEPMDKLANQLGADVLMCLKQQAAFISGTGDIIEPIDNFPALHAVLVNPNIGLSTVKVFTTREAKYSSPALTKPIAENALDFIKRSQNDLTETAISIVPEIQNILDALSNSNATISRMSGSGATCFGLYESEHEAKKTAELLSTKNPNWWVSQCTLS